MYFQTVLSARTPKTAEVMSYLAAVGALLMALPSIFIGAIGKATGTIIIHNMSKHRT